MKRLGRAMLRGLLLSLGALIAMFVMISFIGIVVGVVGLYFGELTSVIIGVVLATTILLTIAEYL